MVTRGKVGGGMGETGNGDEEYIYHDKQSSNYTPGNNMKLCSLFEKIKVKQTPKTNNAPNHYFLWFSQVLSNVRYHYNFRFVPDEK